MSYGASTQSKWVDLLSAARASDGPSENRPPHSDPAFVLTGLPLRRRDRRNGAVHSDFCAQTLVWASLQIPLGGDLRRQAVHMHEALRRGLVEGVALVVRGEVEVVERLGAAAAV